MKKQADLRFKEVCGPCPMHTGHSSTCVPQLCNKKLRRLQGRTRIPGISAFQVLPDGLTCERHQVHVELNVFTVSFEPKLRHPLHGLFSLAEGPIGSAC